KSKDCRRSHRHHYKTRSLNNAIEAEERTPSLLIVLLTQQRLAPAQQLLRRRAPRVVAIQSRSVDRHAPTCAVQADLDPQSSRGFLLQPVRPLDQTTTLRERPIQIQHVRVAHVAREPIEIHVVHDEVARQAVPAVVGVVQQIGRRRDAHARIAARTSQKAAREDGLARAEVAREADRVTVRGRRSKNAAQAFHLDLRRES
ncbi:unnamed protein product, partial [Pelagomonas calceolata]